MSFFGASLTVFTSIVAPAVRRHRADAKAAMTSVYHHLSADFTGGPPNFNIDCL